MFMIGVNRVGSDAKSRFCGHSALIDPWGNVVVEAGETVTYIPQFYVTSPSGCVR